MATVDVNAERNRLMADIKARRVAECGKAYEETGFAVQCAICGEIHYEEGERFIRLPMARVGLISMGDKNLPTANVWAHRACAIKMARNIMALATETDMT